MTGPITPDEVVERKQFLIPEEMFEVVNDLIAKHWNGTFSTIYQSEILTGLLVKGIDAATAFDNHYLDFEDAYRKIGWEVEYDKPAYNENYKAHFRFRRGKA